MRLKAIHCFVGAFLLACHVAGDQTTSPARDLIEDVKIIAMTSCKNSAGEEVLSTDDCQQLAGCDWAPLLYADGFGCLREDTKAWEQRRLKSSCPIDTVATFEDIIPENFDIALIPSSYLGLKWHVGGVIRGDYFNTSGYNHIANASNTEFSVFKFRDTDLVITSSVAGCPWGVGNLMIASAWNDDMNVTFVGTRDARDDCVKNIILKGPAFVKTVNLGDCGLLTSLTIKSHGGTQSSAVNMFGNNVAFQMMEILSEPSKASSATSDPHLIGASGIAYDFDGEPGATYSLFSAPQFQVAMHMAGDGPGTHFMTQIGLLFKGEKFLFGESTMIESFHTDLEERLARVGGALLDWTSYHAKLGLCPGHTVSIKQMHTTDPWLMRADGSPYNYYDVEIVSPGCHDTYDGALGQTYQCKYADGGSEAFAWSQGQEEGFRIPSLFTPSGSYSAEAFCNTAPAGIALSGASVRHQRRGLNSGTGKPAKVQVEAKISESPPEEIMGSLPSQPIGRFHKRAGRRTTEAQVAN